MDEDNTDEVQLDLLPRNWVAQDPEPEPDLEEEPLEEQGPGTASQLPLRQEQDIVEGTSNRREVITIAERSQAVSTAVPNGTQGSQFKKVLRKDSKGRLRLFDQEGNIVEPTPRLLSNRTMAEELNSHGTQKSSLSLTQENSESAYDAYKRKHAQSSVNNSPERNFPSAYITSKNTSLFTNSTAHTYGENDTGHIAFDLAHLQEYSQEEKDAPEDMEVDDEQDSQNQMYSPLKYELPNNTPYAPETPAPPLNPFGNKGALMNPLELFKATQASSTVRAAFYSPTSSRPSPNIFNQFDTPSGVGAPSSPTHQRGVDISSSALRPGLTSDLISQSPAFRTAPENPQSSPIQKQPRAYVTMKESQERRRMEEAETESDSDSDGSISSIEAVTTRRREKINQTIARELSAVAVPATVETRQTRASSRSHSSPAAATSMIEVPSTSKDSTSKKAERRRSIQDDYLAQCTGSDARDTQQDTQQGTQQGTQQDDIIADSQLLPETEIESVEITHSLSHVAESSLPQNPITSVHGHPSQTPVPSRYIAPAQDLPPSQMLPPMSVYEAVNNFDDATIPETSPVRSDRIRPMGEIASFRGDSFNLEDVEAEEYPGFSQDVDFDQAIGVVRESSNSRKGSQIRATRKSSQLSASRHTPEVRKPPEASHVVTGSISESSATRESPQIEAAVSPRNSSPERSPTPTSALKLTSNLLPQKTAGLDDVKTSPAPAVPNLSPKPKPRKSDKLEQETIVPVSKETSEVTPEALPSTKVPPKKIPQPTEQSIVTAVEVETSAASQLKKRNGSSSKVRTPVPSVEPDSSALSSLPDMDTDDEINAAPDNNDFSEVEDIPVSSENAPPDEEELPVFPTSTPVVLKGKGLIKYGKGSSSKKLRRVAKSSSPAQDDLANSFSTVAVVSKAGQKTKGPPKKRSVSQKSLLPKPQREETPVSTETKRASKRKSGSILTDTSAPATSRASKRKSTGRNLRDSSEDPIALGVHPTSSAPNKKTKGIFSNMAFAVSYVSAEVEKDKVTKLIRDNGGQILEDGFDSLFNKSVPTSSNDAKELQLLPSAEKIGFVALIANQHSRRAKFMQALALGLPCISGKWINACLEKNSILDWTVYLLCAGQSVLLGDACRSRTLQPYSAAEAKLVDTFEQRDQFLHGKSILIITGNAKRLESRSAYVFLTRALGPSRIGHAVDLQEARKKLTEAEKDGNEWDMVYVDNEKGAESTLFEDTPGGGSRKRKRASTATSEDTPAPKRIRVICDETVVQSLILGQLMED